MPEIVRELAAEEVEAVTPLLLLAEPSEGALRWSLRNLSDAAYALEDEGRAVAAATVRWRRAPCEIVELAVAPERQGRGYGRRLVEWVCRQAARRGLPEIVVGTRTTSAGNIIFYQKCGFRADHVKRDYFWYYDEPLVEHGVVVRDMLVFRRELAGEGGA
ncbi:MAG TPA: GNAT family N-acetyltransferase [Pyrinomonadaceae bacterium]|nr:GNAT family N-acetyltransferase [Pyrinomonadaceae bacterium]